jgi:hypothetical protein
MTVKKRKNVCPLITPEVHLTRSRNLFLLQRPYKLRILGTSNVFLRQVHPFKHCLKACCLRHQKLNVCTLASLSQFRSKLVLKKQMPTVLRTKVDKSAPKPTQYTYLHESSHDSQRLVPAHDRPPD